MMFGNLDDLPIPEEMKQAIIAQYEHRQMTAESFKHDLQRLLEESTKEHLLTLRHLFAVLAADEDGRYAAYLEGCAAATLSQKHSVCASCGVNHDAELLGAPQSAGDGVQPSMFEQEQESVTSVTEWSDMCEKYGVIDIVPPSDSDTQHEIIGHAVECKNCGTRYVNLADRMMQPADKTGCAGCVNKEKWG